MNVMSSIDAKEQPATETVDELWYKDAIIYQLHVKAFADSNNDGIGDFAGLTEKLGYLQDLGVTALWLLPFYPSPGRDDGYDIADYGDINPDFGTHEGFPALHRRSQAPRPAGHHRTRHQPYLRPARLVQARAPQRSEIERAQLVCLERHRPEIPGHADHLHRYREIELDLGSGSRPVLLAPLLLAPARPEFRQSARGQRDHSGDEALARHRRRRLPARRHSLSLRARRHQQREPAGNPRHHQEAARRTRRLFQGQGAAGRGQSMAGGRAGIFRPRRRMPHGLSFPADAADLHGDRAGGPLSDHRHPAPDAGYSGKLPVGAVPAQPRRTDAGNGHRRRARLSVVDLRQRSPRPHQCRHPPPAGAADGQRPPQDRADELAAAVVSGHADHLLRRRDRHGRQHLSRRPQRRPHADAMDARPQWRLLPRRSGPALCPDHHGPGLWL